MLFLYWIQGISQLLENSLKVIEIYTNPLCAIKNTNFSFNAIILIFSVPCISLGGHGRRDEEAVEQPNSSWRRLG